MKKPEFSPSALQHVYQRAVDKGVIFYTTEDRIVYYTLASVKAKRHAVTVPAASLMFTHIHQSAQAHSLGELRDYLHDVDTAFSRRYNNRYRREGRLFDKPAGMAQKSSLKSKKSNLIYVYNNHVEKRLCTSAAQERWSLVAYAFSDHPFSEKIDPGEASGTLKKAMRLVDRRLKKLKPLGYDDLRKILPQLDGKEGEQFIDYVISRYRWVDFDAAAAHFGTLDAMMTAMDSTTGGEYDIREEHTNLPDTPYRELVAMVKDQGLLGQIYTMGAGQLDELIWLAARARAGAGAGASAAAFATRHHIESFFHLPRR